MRDQFMRIAMAVLKNQYPNTQQRLALSAKLWTKHLQREALKEIISISETEGLYDKQQ